MKRILYSCLLFLSVYLSDTLLKAQLPQFVFTPSVQCYSPQGAISGYTAIADFLPNDPAATTYSWTGVGPNPTCNPTFTPQAGGVPSNSLTLWHFPCCGVYTVNAFSFNGPTIIAPYTKTVEVICQTSSSAAVTVPGNTNNILCIGESATITPVGAATYTWSNGFIGAPLVVSPSVNTCYTYTGTTAQGCSVTSAASCVSVQAITGSLSPASQTMCALSPVNFTANASIVTGSSVTPGTSVFMYEWRKPPAPNTAFATTTTNALFNIANDPAAAGGEYEVVIVHNGAAGSCSLVLTSTVDIAAAIPVTITPVSPSVCPGSAITLTAISIQTTAAANFTWTAADAGGTPTIQPTNGRIITIPGINPITTVTVDVDYFGCPGQATTTIGLLTLTPSVTSSAPFTCPGQQLTLTANGGVSHTFIAYPAFPASSFVIPNSTANTATHAPALADMMIQYCISSDSAGCIGSACTIVDLKVLTPSLTASSESVCPGTAFTLTPIGSGVDATSSFTYEASYNANIGNAYPLVHTPTGTNIVPQSYTVTVDSAGCQGTAIVNVGLLTLTPTLTSSSPSICAGTSLTLNSTGGAGTQYTFTSSEPEFNNVPTSTLIASPVSNTVMHTPQFIAPVITYTVDVDSAGCIGSASHSIGVLDLGPTLTLTTLPLSGSVCPGSTVTINALGATNYTFYSTPTTTFATGSAVNNTDTVRGTATVPNVIPPLTGVVYTVQADSSTCVGSQTITIREFKLNPSVVLSPTLVCKGQEVVVTASNVGTGTMVSYAFYTLTATAPSPIPLPSAPGSFSTTDHPVNEAIYTVVVDSAGCTGPMIPPSATITLRPDIPLVPSTSAASVCPGLTATLSVAAPTTALSYTYTWSQSSGTGQITPPLDTQTIVAYPFTNSTYSVHVLDSLGCVGNTVISVAIDPSISFSINLASSGSTICAAQSVSLTASSTVALNNNSYGAINYSWTPSFGISPTTGSTVVGSPTITTLYTVTADNGYGCVSQNTIFIPVGTIPNPIINPTAGGVCVGFTSTLTASGANSYTWTGGTFTNSIVQHSISVGPGTYTVLASNGGGCTNTAVTTITLLPNLVLDVSQSSPTTCIESNSPKFSQPVKLTASGAGSYHWFGPEMTYSLGPQTDVRPPATTQYTVIGSTAICSGTAVIQVTVIPQFTVNVTPPLPAMCLGDSMKLDVVNVGTLAVGPPSALTYSWTEALNAPPISMSSYFSPTVMVFPQNTTTYTTEVRDSRDCISFPRLITVTVLPRPLTSIAIPTINGVPTNTVCFVGLNPGAEDVTINLTASNLNTGLQFGVVPTYTWTSPYEPQNISILTPANDNAIIVSAPVRHVNNSSVAVYTLISGYNGVQGCKRIDTVSVRSVDCRPVRGVKWTTADQLDTICARSCITFITQTDTMSGGPQSYEWTFKGGSPATSTLANPSVCYNFPSSTAMDVILKVSNPYPLINPTGGPPGSTLAIGILGYVKVVDIPNVTIVAPGQVRSDTVIRFGQSVNLNGSGARTYEWSPAYNISSLTNPKVTVNPFKTTQYILKGYNSRACASSDTINVIIVEDCGEMYVPNAFTPNNDGINDILYVRGICLQSLTFMVFNRWGEKIFETADQAVGWDGTYKGQELNTGVFVYRLEGKTYDGKGFSSKGNITLIR